MMSREEFEKKALEVLKEEKTRRKLGFVCDELCEFIISDSCEDISFDEYLLLLYDKLIED